MIARTTLVLWSALLAVACTPPGRTTPEGAFPLKPETSIIVEVSEGGLYRTAPEKGGWVQTVVRGGRADAIVFYDQAGEWAATISPLRARMDVDADGRPTWVDGAPKDLQRWAERTAAVAAGEVTSSADKSVTIVATRSLVPGALEGAPSGEVAWLMQELRDGTVLVVAHRPDWRVPAVHPHTDD